MSKRFMRKPAPIPYPVALNKAMQQPPIPMRPAQTTLTFPTIKGGIITLILPDGITRRDFELFRKWVDLLEDAATWKPGDPIDDNPTKTEYRAGCVWVFEDRIEVWRFGRGSKHYYFSEQRMQRIETWCKLVKQINDTHILYTTPLR